MHNNQSFNEYNFAEYVNIDKDASTSGGLTDDDIITMITNSDKNDDDVHYVETINKEESKKQLPSITDGREAISTLRQIFEFLPHTSIEIFNNLDNIETYGI